MKNYELISIQSIFCWIRLKPEFGWHMYVLSDALQLLKQYINMEVSTIDFVDIERSITNNDYFRDVYTTPDGEYFPPISAEEKRKFIIDNGDKCLMDDVTDINVYKFLYKTFEEIIKLSEKGCSEKVDFLSDALHNMPVYIYKKSKMPYRKLKSELRPYWRKYDKNFLKDFIKNR